MIALIPLLVAVIGVLIYALSNNPKMVEIGRILFFVGTFVTVLGFAGDWATVFPGLKR